MVIDEIQRVPEILTAIHVISEEPSPLHFVLAGSGARKRRRGGMDLLGARAVHRTMHPFMASELPEFDFDRALQSGLLSPVMDAADPADVLDAYATLYLDEDALSAPAGHRGEPTPVSYSWWSSSKLDKPGGPARPGGDASHPTTGERANGAPTKNSA